MTTTTRPHSIPVHIPVHIAFPSLEAAVSALCEKTFGAELHLELPAEPQTAQERALWRYYNRLLAQLGKGEPEAAPAEELTAWMEACHRKDADIDKLLADNAGLGEENGRLHALWHGAVADAAEQRDEVQRLDVANRNLRQENARLENRVKVLDASETNYLNFWEDACDALRKVTAERNALHARVAMLEAKPQYRELAEGEPIEAGDEWTHNGVSDDWSQVKRMWVGKVNHNPRTKIRRKVTP